jgi:hypothetical protein
MRGRNNNGGGGGNNNRKGPNPLTRNYESNGPDVKIRGSAQQIAEKYAALARDAMSSGDRVMAENYLQHAEHYNRIIAAAQAQMPIQNVQSHRDDFDDDGDEDRDEFEQGVNGNVSESPVAQAGNGSGPQPVIEGTPAEVALNDDDGRESRDGVEAREGNGGRRHRERRHNGYQGGQRQAAQSERQETAEEQPAEEAAVKSEAPQPATSEPVADLSPAAIAAQVGQADEAAAPRRPRRPRRRAEPQADAGEASGSEAPATADAN